MVLFITAIILAISTFIIAVKLDLDDVIPAGLTIAGILFLISIASSGPEFSSKVIYMNPLIDVNGYYVDPVGNYVTEDNRHGHIDLNIVGGIPVTAAKTAPTLIESETFHKKNWYAFSNRTERTQEISFEERP